MESFLFKFAFAAYTAALIFYLSFAASRKEALPRFGQWSLWAAVLLHFASFFWSASSGWFASLSFFAWVLSIEFLVLLVVRPLPILGVFVAPIVWICLLFAVHSPAPARPESIAVAMQSTWMAIHVPLMFIAYSAFALAFGTGLAYLVEENQLKSKKVTSFIFRLPSLDDLDRLVGRMILFGFPVLTLGLMSGMLWAKEAWGEPWSWDPKQTWTFLTWLIYAAYLFTREFAGWRGRKSAYLSIAGFIVVLVSYVGVNVLAGHHGYDLNDKLQMTDDKYGK